jgi:hypothetical protein
VDALIKVKHRRAAENPELFAAYWTPVADAQSIVATHLDELVGLSATVIRSGVKVSNQKRISMRFRREQKSERDETMIVSR